MSAAPKDESSPDERLAQAGPSVSWLSKMESSDFLLEERLGRILRVGVYASSACLGLGLLLSLTTGAVAVSGWLMTGGLMMLMATPVARVAASVVEYGVHRDWTFFTLTAIVLLELCAGIVAALVFHKRL
jgi:uncharacterized membrane protein